MNETNSRNVWAANQWLINAYDALKVANLSLEQGIYNHACLNAHQTIELSFKAAFRWQGNPQPSKTHVLVTLYENLVKVLPSIADSIEYLFTGLEDITRYYVDARYERPYSEISDAFARYDEEEARIAVDTAQTIYQTIRNMMALRV